MCTICNIAKKAHVKVIETCCKTVFLLSQLTCINTYIKYVTEKCHKKIVNNVKSTLASVVQNNLLGPENCQSLTAQVQLLAFMWRERLY